MSGDAGRSIREAEGIDEREQAVDRLQREFSCLVDLGVLADDETAAFTMMLDELLGLLVQVRSGDARLGQELVSLTLAFAADLDLAYQRLSAAA